MFEYSRQSFLNFAIEQEVLRFGDFKLKSGRQSPYFFNLGQIDDGQSLIDIGHYYAQAIQDAQLNYDLIFGPAYKGIPLVCATAIALAQRGRKVPWCFNRKEVKSHGEGGGLVGGQLSGKVVLVDDVITAGTAIKEAIHLINHESDAEVTGVVVAIDRQEKGESGFTALQEIEDKFQIPVITIITLDQMIDAMRINPVLKTHIDALRIYRENHGAI